MSNTTVPAAPYQPSPAYHHVATEADVVACYRLLLGRQPDPSGLEGFRRLVRKGHMPVLDIVRTFLTSPEFQSIHHPDKAATLQQLQLSGFQLYVSDDDYSMCHYLSDQGGYEPHVVAVLRSLLRPGMHVVDIGANIGFFSMLAAGIVGPGGKVYAFEPGQNNAAMIEASSRLNGYTGIIDIWPLGLSDGPRMMLLAQQGSNGFVQEFQGMPPTTGQRSVVKCIALDTLGPLFERLDVIKIDIEGSEAAAFRGAQNLIRRFRPAVCSEFSPPMLKGQSHCSGAEYLQLWTGSGYDVSVIQQNGELLRAESNEVVLNYFDAANTTHIDLLFTPRV